MSSDLTLRRPRADEEAEFLHFYQEGMPFRRRGYATAILGLALEIARDQRGLHRVLVTCDDGNIGSIRAIETNGGILENVVTSAGLDTPTRRYWLATRDGPGAGVDAGALG